MSTTDVQEVPKKILIPYRIISVIMGIYSAVMLYTAISFLRTSSYGVSLSFIFYAGAYVLFAIGFWKMKRWVLSFFSTYAILSFLLIVINIARSSQSIGRSIGAFLFIGIIFLFTWLSRKFLKDEHASRKTIGLFAALMIAMLGVNILIYFMKFITK